MIERQLRETLQRFTDAAKRGDGKSISQSLNELESIHQNHRHELDPRLEHFLAGRSYAKALAWLGGDLGESRPASPPNGCQGGRS